MAQLKRLVDDLLEVSRISTGRLELRRVLLTLGGIVAGAVEMTQALIEARHHELTVSVPERAIWVYADATRLQQVIVNLLGNAAKYTDEGGHIWLAVAEMPGEAIVRVRDTGSGIALSHWQQQTAAIASTASPAHAMLHHTPPGARFSPSNLAPPALDRPIICGVFGARLKFCGDIRDGDNV